MDQVEHHPPGHSMSIRPIVPVVAGMLMPDAFVADGLILGMPPWVLAVIVCALMSVLTVCGFVLQKQAVTTSEGHRRIGDIVLSARWLLGFSLVSISPILGDLVAYALAPMSLITPLCGISVALNLCVAPRLLGERLQLRVDLTATLLILTGMVMTSAVGPKQEINYSPTELLQLCMRPGFLAVMSALLLALIGCFTVMWLKRASVARAAERNPSNPNIGHVVIVAFAATGPGAISNILLKTVSEMIAQNDWLQCLASVVLLVPFAVLQLNFINRGLRYYPQTVFFPIYQTMLVVGNTTLGAIYFKEFKILFLHRANATVFLLGMLFVSAGILCFAQRSVGTTEVTEADHCRSLQTEQDIASVQCVGLAASFGERAIGALEQLGSGSGVNVTSSRCGDNVGCAES